MLTIRFARIGRKNRSQFRIVLQEHTAAPGGRHIAILGSYDPHQKKAVLKADKINEWISKGAQASDSVFNLLVKEGVVKGEKKSIKMPKPKAKEATDESAKEEAKADEPAKEEAKADEPAKEEKKAE